MTQVQAYTCDRPEGCVCGGDTPGVRAGCTYFHPIGGSTDSAEGTYVHKALPSKTWRCYHCDEEFHSNGSAKLHFGMDQSKDPACKIKAGAEMSLLVALRRCEKELDEAWSHIHQESSEAAVAYRAQQARHQEQLAAAEELGYERGLKAGRKAAMEEYDLI